MIEINIDNKEYPQNLKKIKNPPCVLYAQGNIELLYQPSIAIIGSRLCTTYGERMAKKFSKELSEYGINTISGMAKGIDTIVHKETLRVQGKTIAVLPCGFKYIFPKENTKLYNEILEGNGLIITEYPDNVKADSKKFLERNRIVSGLALGTLVVEGGRRSGTSVTAKLTKQQEKNVFCIPSSLENSKGVTPNNLIKNGAVLVTDVNDIIEKYKYLNLKRKKLTPQNYNLIKEEYRDIFNILPKDGIIHIDEIAQKLDLSIQEINYKLTMLELEEKIEALPGQNYRRKR